MTKRERKYHYWKRWCKWMSIPNLKRVVPFQWFSLGKGEVLEWPPKFIVDDNLTFPEAGKTVTITLNKDSHGNRVK